MTYRGHELEYLGRLTDPSATDEYRCRLCGFAIAGNVFRTSTRAWSEVWVPKCDPLKRIRALERELAEARACGSPCPECRDLADLDAALRCSKERPKALAVFGHRWTGSARCAFCNVDRATVEKLSGFRLSPDAFATKENKPMQKQKRDALETLRRVLAESTEQQQDGLAALIEVEPEVIRRCAARCRAEAKPRHDVLGDMSSVLLQHGGSWDITSEIKLGARFLRVRWNNPAGEERRVTVARDASTRSLEQVCSEALGVIEHYTRPDGGLDL